MTASLEQQDQSSSSCATLATSSTTSFCSKKLQNAGNRNKKNKFRGKRYDNVEHKWDRKPFVQDKVRFLFGGMDETKMERVVSQKRKQIQEAGIILANDHKKDNGLVLNDMCRPFQCKLLFSTSQKNQSHDDNDDDDDALRKKLPSNMKIEYLSGTWLSKVYRGSYDHFLDWVDDAQAHVQEHYGGLQVDPHVDWFTYYPSALENQKSNQEAVLVFFIKVADCQWLE